MCETDIIDEVSQLYDFYWHEVAFIVNTMTIGARYLPPYIDKV